MSETDIFPELINLVEVDPFAPLGISVSADEKRIVKRYRQVAKQLHPDALTGISNGIDPAIAAQVIARIVNPSYQKLKHEKIRRESLATIRFHVRHLDRTQKLIPTFHNAQQLAQVAHDEVDTFYEQALSKLADSQFQTIGNLHLHTLEISQLNLVYLRCKMESSVIRSKRTGLIVNAVTPTAASAPTVCHTTTTSPPEATYVQRHTARAKTYLSQQNYDMAVQELREALKISPQDSEIHSLMGQAYYKQNLTGMAKIHFRQALKFKPTHRVAQKYSKLLGITLEDQNPPLIAIGAEKNAKSPWLGKLLNR